MGRNKDFWKAAFWLKQNYRWIIFASMVFVASYLVFGYRLKLAIILFALIAVAALSTFYYNYFHGPVNFELIKLATVLASVSHGIFIGVAVGIVATILSRLWSGRFDHRTLISILGIVAVAASAAVFGSNDIRALGVALVILYHLLTAPISIATGDSPSFTFTYALTNIAFNAAVFYWLAPLLLALMRL